MACAFSAEDLSCSVCLCVFTEPLTLACGHSFCRGCITGLRPPLCPQCRAVLPGAGEMERLVTNHILKSLAEKAKECGPGLEPGPGLGPGPGRGPGQVKEEPLLCPEHDERLKLFCLTDQCLACIICRDGEAHDGHKFKPIREAAASLRRDLDLGLVNVESQISKIQNLRQAQSREMNKAKTLSGNLQNQIHEQFETLHQCLRKREDEIRNELKTNEDDAVQNMSQSLSAMERAEEECTEQRKSWTQLMQVSDPEMFLKHWSEAQRAAASKDVFKEWSEGLSVVQSPLFEGPFQSHLQFFMWKDLLQVVEPKPDLLTLRDDNIELTVSEDRRSFHCTPQSWTQQQQEVMLGPTKFKSSYRAVKNKKNAHLNMFSDYVEDCSVPQTLFLSSTNEFSSGQHYWEVEVGLRSFWCVGIRDYFLKYENGTYFCCSPGVDREVPMGGALRRVGVYLNCSSPGVSFYDAESMVQLLALDCRGLVLPVCAFFSVQKNDLHTSPVTVCRY